MEEPIIIGTVYLTLEALVLSVSADFQEFSKKRKIKISKDLKELMKTVIKKLEELPDSDD
jgi:hypothetical protein